MDAITCNYCQCLVDTRKLLLEHISNYHKPTNDFQCYIQNCNRAYTTYSSFYKHISRKHNCLTKNDSKIKTRARDNEECFSTIENSSCYQPMYSDESDSDDTTIYDSDASIAFENLTKRQIFYKKYCKILW